MPPLSSGNAARLDRLSDWYLPGRFGLFFHYGLYRLAWADVRRTRT